MRRQALPQLVVAHGVVRQLHDRVDALARWVWERVHTARTMKASTPAGTRLTASFDPGIRWLRTTGIITPEKWTNLPGGEVFTAPARVDGVYVADGVLGDWMAPKYGDMRADPLTVTIEDSRIVRVECNRPEIVSDFARSMRLRRVMSRASASNEPSAWRRRNVISIHAAGGRAAQRSRNSALPVAGGDPTIFAQAGKNLGQPVRP